MLKKILCSALVIISFSAFAQGPSKGPLDGKRFTAEIQEEGKKKPLDPDDLNFASGKIKSNVFGDWGFLKGAKYEIMGIDSTSTQGVKIYSWGADMINEQEEKLAWSGTCNGESIEGTIELVNKKGVVKKTFTFTGTLKKKPGQK